MRRSWLAFALVIGMALGLQDGHGGPHRVAAQTPVPSIRSLTPDRGPAAGGTVITISGSNLLGVEAATFGSTQVSNITCSASSCTVTSPPGSPGTVQVTLIAELGIGSNALPFTYVGGAATVTSVSPDYGPSTGGTLVTITGTGFASSQQFQTDTGQAFTGVSCSSATTCTAMTPRLTVADGAVQQFRTVAAGQTAPPSSNPFTAYGRPTITSLDPASGPAAGDTLVWLTGGIFPNGSPYPGPLPVVHFGDAPATNVNCSGRTGTVCGLRTPPGSGTVQVTISTPGGTSSGRPFTYAAGPVVTAVSPSYGPSTGGTLVTITGTGFASSQQFQTDTGQAFTGVSCSSATTCTARTPALTVATGAAVNFRTVAVGQTGAPQSNAFTAYGLPQITNVTPSDGPPAGGTAVTLQGGIFPNGSVYAGPVPQVLFGGIPATDVSCTSAAGTTCTVRTPPAANPNQNKVVEVTITTPGGTSAVNEADYFLYLLQRPTVTGLMPNHGTGGTLVTITGTNFSTTPGDTTVAFGQLPAPDVTCASTTQCTARAPAGMGTVSVLVTVDGWTSADTPADDFTYAPEPAPVVTAIAPDYGSAAGGVTVTITGTNFVAGQQFQTDGGLPFTDVVCASTTSCTGKTPAVAAPLPGKVTTFRTVAEGQTAPPQSNPFTVYGRPVITEINPYFGPTAGGNVVWVTGGMFPNGGNPYPGPAPDVRFGNASATGVNCTGASGTVCAVHVPPGSGTVQVTITTPGGTSEPAGLPYSYIPTPVITSIRPDFGVPTGGNTVSITGTGFITEEDAMTAMFGSAPANGTTCSSTTSCVAYSPPGSLGTVPLTIVNVWGDTSNAVPFTYKLPPPPTVEQISPNYGASAGYNLVTITGQNFTARQQFQLADGGMFDTVECSSSTTCTALTPPHSGNPNSAVPVGTIAVGQTEPPAPESRFFYYDPPQTNWWISDCYNWFPEYRLVRIAPHQWFCFQGAPFAYGSSEAPGVTRVQVHDTWDAPEHVQCSSEYQMCSARTPDLGTSWSDCLAWGGSQSVGIYVETPGGTTQVTSVHYQCWCQWDLCSSPIGGSSTMPPIDVPPHPSQPPPARRARRRRRAYRCHQTTRRRAVESSRSRRLRAA